MIQTRNFLRIISHKYRRMCSSKSSDTSSRQSSEDKNSKDEIKLPEEPTNCCMSGCENCVWIQYAQELTEMYKDSGSTAQKIILEKITDPSMQVFLKIELQTIEKRKPISIEDIQTRPPKPKKY